MAERPASIAGLRYLSLSKKTAKSLGLKEPGAWALLF